MQELMEVKTVLIPTDFTIESLNLFKKFIQKENGSVRVVFFHCVAPADSIVELLFYSEERALNSVINNDFTQAWSILKNKYNSRVVTDKITIFNGNTQGAFGNFLFSNKIDEILIPGNYQLKRTSPRSFDPKSFIRNSGIPVNEISWPTLNVPEKSQLAELFND